MKCAQKVDLWKFIYTHVAWPDRSNIEVRFFASPLMPLQKIRTSSTKIRCEILKVGDKETPKNSPLDFAAPIALLSPSTTNRNSPLDFVAPIAPLIPSTTNKKRSGDKGQPFLNPLSAEKKGKADPFIRTKKDTVEMQFMIQSIKGISNSK
jgi:hypothetical protein